MFHTDERGEYVTKEEKEYLKEQDTEHQATVPNTPDQNGVAERKNCTPAEMARCMFLDAGLPFKYWYEAMKRAAHR